MPPNVPIDRRRVAGRDQALDLLRTVALVRVVLWHLYAQTWMTWFAAIPLMFFVAGTLLDQRGRGPLRSFLVRRGRRLLLPLWLYGAVVAVASLLVADRGGDTASGPFVRALTWVVPVVDPRSPGWSGGWLSSHLWYLRAYLWILVLSPLLVRAARRVGRSIGIGLAGVVILELASRTSLPGLRALGHGTPRMLVGDALVYGFFAMLGIAYRQGRLRASTRARVLVGLIGAGAALAYAGAVGLPTGGVNASYPAIAFTGIAWLFGCAAIERPLRAFADRDVVARATRRISSRALTIYLWHPACIAIATHVVRGTGRADGAGRLLVTIALIVVAVGLTGWVEDLASATVTRSPARAESARRLGLTTALATLAIGASVPLVGGVQVSAASAGASATTSLAIGLPAPSTRAALADSAFAPAPDTMTAKRAVVSSRRPVPAAPPTIVAPVASTFQTETLEWVRPIPTAPPSTLVTTTIAPAANSGSRANLRRTKITPAHPVPTRAPAPVAGAPAAVTATTAMTRPTILSVRSAVPSNVSSNAVKNTVAVPAAVPAALPFERLQKSIDGWRLAQQPAVTSMIVSIRRGTQTWSARSTAPGVVPKYDANAPFAAASITKTFTAALVLRAVERGALSLDADVPVLHDLTVPVPSGLSVRRLLTHTSGLVDYSLASGYVADAPLTALDAVTLSLKEPLQPGVGTEVRYANSNYLYLGLLIEQIEGRSYAQLVDELTATAGLHDTHLGDATRPGWIGFSSGGIVATAADLAQWGQALFTPGKILGPIGLSLLTTIGPVNIGLGAWPACPCSSDAQGVKHYTAIGHHTADGAMFTFPATGITVVAMFEPTGEDTHGRIVSLASAIADALA